MRIRTVQAWWVRIPIEESRQHRSDFGRLTTFDSAILRIETDDGLVGWGEGKNAAGSAGTYAGLVHLLNHEVAPRLIGRDPANITAIWEMLYNGVRHESAAKSGHAMPELSRRGLSVAAISYYVVGLVAYLAKALSEAGLPVDAGLVTGLSVPVAVLLVWLVVRQIRKSHHADAAER